MAKTSDNQVAEQLKGVPLFANTTAKQRKTLAKLGKTVKWKEGSVPIKQGTKGAAFFLILDGGVDVVRKGDVLARLGAGDFVGEMALLSTEPRSADVEAIADTTAFAFGRPALAAAMRTDPSICMGLLEAMAARQASTR